MSAFAALDALDTELAPEPKFLVEPPDKRRDLAELPRQATFRRLLASLAPSLEVHANANAGKRNPTQAKKEGITAGVFDLTVSSGTIGNRFVAWVEFKGYQGNARAGKLSLAQIEWGNRKYAAGHHVACFFSPDAAVEWIRSISPSPFVDSVGRR